MGQLPASDAISCNEMKEFSEKVDCRRNDISIPI